MAKEQAQIQNFSNEDEQDDMSSITSSIMDDKWADRILEEEDSYNEYYVRECVESISIYHTFLNSENEIKHISKQEYLLDVPNNYSILFFIVQFKKYLFRTKIKLYDGWKILSCNYKKWIMDKR